MTQYNQTAAELKRRQAIALRTVVSRALLEALAGAKQYDYSPYDTAHHIRVELRAAGLEIGWKRGNKPTVDRVQKILDSCTD